MTATAMFGGATFGELLAAGLVTEKDKRRAAEMAATNFRNGIDIGRKAAVRSLAGNFEGTA